MCTIFNPTRIIRIYSFLWRFIFKIICLGSFSSNTTGQLNILGHDGYTLGVDSAKIGIFEKTNQVGLGRFLEGQDGRSLESQITLEILGNLTNQTLEGKFSDEEIRALLVSTNLAKGDGSGSVSVGLLDSSGGGGRLSGGLGGELLAWGLTSGGFTSSLKKNQNKNKMRSIKEGNLDEFGTFAALYDF